METDGIHVVTKNDSLYIHMRKLISELVSLHAHTFWIHVPVLMITEGLMITIEKFSENLNGNW